MDLAEIGKRIELERVRLGLKSSEICTQLSIHANTYRNYELGKRDMPASLLAKLWHMGFDAMYVLTGQNMGDIATDVINNDESYVQNYHQRLIHLPEVMDLENPADKLLTAMYHAEEALVQCGASSGVDYSRLDLAKIGVGIVDKIK